MKILKNISITEMCRLCFAYIYYACVTYIIITIYIVTSRILYTGCIIAILLIGIGPRNVSGAQKIHAQFLEKL